MVCCMLSEKEVFEVFMGFFHVILHLYINCSCEGKKVLFEIDVVCECVAQEFTKHCQMLTPDCPAFLCIPFPFPSFLPYSHVFFLLLPSITAFSMYPSLSTSACYHISLKCHGLTGKNFARSCSFCETQATRRSST